MSPVDLDLSPPDDQHAAGPCAVGADAERATRGVGAHGDDTGATPEYARGEQPPHQRHRGGAGAHTETGQSHSMYAPTHERTHTCTHAQRNRSISRSMHAYRGK